MHETPAKLHLELLEVQLVKKAVALMGISREALRDRRMESSGSVSVMDSCVGREEKRKRKKKRRDVGMFFFFLLLYFFPPTSSAEGRFPQVYDLFFGFELGFSDQYLFNCLNAETCEERGG